jgi:putative FmdB family regulatory protein
MPIFEYTCRDCGKTFEELVLGGGDEDIVCPHCGSSKVGKLMSCCRGKMGGGKDMDAAPAAKASAPSSSSGGCAGCSGGSCATCH